MALCLIMIAARIGCVVANNLVATQLYTTCDNIFYVFGGVLLCKFINKRIIFFYIQNNETLNIFLTACGFVFLTVPTNSNST